MKCDRWPTQVKGKTFLVDATFDKSPAVFIMRAGRLVHVDSPDSEMSKSYLQGLEDGQVIIFAHQDALGIPSPSNGEVRFESLLIGAFFRLHELHRSVWVNMKPLSDAIAGLTYKRNCVCVFAGDGRNTVGDIGTISPLVSVYPVSAVNILKRQHASWCNRLNPLTTECKPVNDHCDCGGYTSS